MQFADFCEYLQKLDQTSSRIEITKILADLLQTLSQEEMREATYLLTGSVGAQYETHLFNVAEKMLLRAIAQAFDIDIEQVSQTYKKRGDLGEVAFHFASAHKAKKQNLTVHDTFLNLHELTQESGEGSQEKRIGLIADALKESNALSAKYYARIISGNLRLGFSEKTIIDALSWMETGGKSKSALVMKAFEVIPDIGLIAEKVKVKGIEKATQDVTPIVGIPIVPMLSQRLKSPAEMIQKMGTVSVEPKFDGLRVLIHFSAKTNTLKAYTRNLKEISTMFPELSEIQKHIHGQEVILDSEAVGMDPALMKLADFQTTMQRRRKHEITDISQKIPITFQVFDILYKDGQSLMHAPYTKRREALKQTVKNGSLLKVDDFTITDDPTVITKLHKEYRGNGLEGIIVKKAASEYVPGRLGWRWVKMKEAEKDTGKLADTIDAVIMGYTAGQGKRVSFGVGQFLAGIVYHDQIKTVTKVGTGLTDAQFRELNTLLQELTVEDMPKEYEVHKNLIPDFWVKPKIVVELAADDITVSPNHTAGYALRFPRLVKMRADKSVKQATTLTELVKLFKLQKK